MEPGYRLRGSATFHVLSEPSTTSARRTSERETDQKIQKLIPTEFIYKDVRANEKAIKELTTKIGKLNKEIGAERNRFKKGPILGEMKKLQEKMDGALQKRAEHALALREINLNECTPKQKAQIKKTEQEIVKGNESTIKHLQKRLDALNYAPFFRKKQFSLGDLDKMAELMQEVEKLETNKDILDFKSASKLNKLKLKLGKAVVSGGRGLPVEKNLEKFIGEHLNRLVRNEEKTLYKVDLDTSKLLPVKYAVNYLEEKLKGDDLRKLVPIKQRILVLEETEIRITNKSNEEKKEDLKLLDRLLGQLSIKEHGKPALDDASLALFFLIKHGNNNSEVQQKVKLCEAGIHAQPRVKELYEKREKEWIESAKLTRAERFLDAEADELLNRIWNREPYLFNTLLGELHDIASDQPSLKKRAETYIERLQSIGASRSAPKY